MRKRPLILCHFCPNIWVQDTGAAHYTFHCPLLVVCSSSLLSICLALRVSRSQIFASYLETQGQSFKHSKTTCRNASTMQALPYMRESGCFAWILTTGELASHLRVFRPISFAKHPVAGRVGSLRTSTRQLTLQDFLFGHVYTLRTQTRLHTDMQFIALNSFINHFESLLWRNGCWRLLALHLALQ